MALKAALRKRAAIEANIKLLLEDIPSVTPGGVQSLVNELQHRRQEIDENHSSLITVYKDNDVDDIVRRTHKTRREINRALEQLQAQIPVPTPSPSPTSSSRNFDQSLRLPELQFPTFSGIHTEWPAFATMFIDGISQYTLSESQKLHFLIKSLKGPACSVIASITISQNSFTEAWDLLKAKYENKRDIIYQLVQKIFNSSPVSTSSEIEVLIDTTREVLRSLKLVGRTITTESDTWIVPYTLQRLDETTRFHWEQSRLCSPTDLATIEDLLSFLQSWAKTRKNAVKGAEPFQHPVVTVAQKSKTAHIPRTCVECQLEHSFHKCPVLTQAEVDDRWILVKKHKVCHLCLNPSHRTTECSFKPCRKCGKLHNSLLHKDMVSSSAQSNITNAVLDKRVALLSTAVMKIADSRGEHHNIRMMLDTCSTSSYLHQKVLDKLGLPATDLRTTISTVNGNSTVSQRETNAVISSLDNRYSLNISLLTMNNTQIVPTDSVFMDLKPFINFTLADPNFHTAGESHGILGADVLSEVLKESVLKIGGVTLLDSIFGWVITGAAPSINASTSLRSKNIANFTSSNISHFWELEEVPKFTIATPEQVAAENIYVNTTKQLLNGRFQTSIPFKNNPPNLGASHNQAIKRFFSLENQMDKNPLLKKLHQETMQEYLDLGHMVQVPFQENSYFMPHHGIIKNSKKLRIVFDASAKTTNNRSLNDEMLDCPKTQPDLFHILLKFRQYQYALTGDIIQMYRQVGIDPSQHHLQSIVWRFDKEAPVETYQLTTVTWGTKTAPFLATRTLAHIVNLIQSSNQEVAQRLRENFYVDDCMSGADSIEEVIHIYYSFNKILAEYGFTFHKWATNSDELRQHLPEPQSDTSCLAAPDENKTLGIFWNYRTDQFNCKIKLIQLKTLTKRAVLAQTNSIFDPLGWISPLTLKLKLFIQSLWKSPIGWDTHLPHDKAENWRKIIEDINFFDVTIPRKIVPFNTWELTLCGFSDASEVAYSAAVYLRAVSPAGITVSLIAAKNKVAPTTPTTLPRLELCGALLLARLIKSVQVSFTSPLPVMAWTDSKITLGWVSSHASRWKTFVSHRVHEIQQVIPAHSWRHVPGALNPADLSTRPINSMEFSHNSHQWLCGPKFLLSSDFDKITPIESISIEEKPAKTLVFFCQLQHISPVFSNFKKTFRVHGYVLRFIHNCRTKKTGLQRRHGRLELDEINDASQLFWKALQQENFPEEYKLLANGAPLPNHSKILSLTPFLDKAGLIRVGGRLHQSKLPEHQKHPILLPKHHFIQNYILEKHKENLHAGPNLLATILQSEFWITNIISTIKNAIHKCVKCARFKAATASQLMANLPEFRITQPSHPFSNAGCDFMGPITLRTHLSRGTRHYKSWAAIFVCLATRAVHIELVTALSAEAFSAALHRFVSRRGLPHTIHTDHGSNFQGTANLLNELQAQNVAMREGIQWRFIPPNAPHFGGIWEAGVKSTKYHLHRIIGTTPYTYEEMSTLLTRIEACLNSRPLTALSSDPNDLRALTPAHFLIGAELHTVPEPELPDKIPPLKRWAHIQKLTEHFWKRWSNEYLTRLQQRPKWLKAQPNLEEGKLVLIKEDGGTPLKWRLARIVEVHKGNDKLVRSATVRTQTKTFVRPIVKLIPLPLDD